MAKKEDEEKSPWVVFRLDLTCTKPNCKCCGYFIGPGHTDENKRGKPVYWMTQEEKK